MKVGSGQVALRPEFLTILVLYKNEDPKFGNSKAAQNRDQRKSLTPFLPATVFLGFDDIIAFDDRTNTCDFFIS